MSRVLQLAGSLFLFSCAGGQLAELEEEHDALQAEYDDLRENVEGLKNEMVSLGLITQQQANARAKVAPKGGKTGKAGKAPAGRRGRVHGNPRPKNELSEQLTWTATRSGDPADLGSLGTAERAGGDCGWKLTLESLQPLSDFPLNRDGFGKSGPVVLFEDGQPMTAHAMPEAFENTCSGAFRHAGYTFLFSPTGTVEDGGRRTYTAALASDFPLARGDDERPMYWVYPGTTATFSFSSGWNAEWGESRLAIAGRLIGEGAAGLDAPGLERDLDTPGNFHIAEVIEPGAEAFTVEVQAPEGGPYVLIDTLTLGNPDNAVVVTAEAAWAARENK